MSLSSTESLEVFIHDNIIDIYEYEYIHLTENEPFSTNFTIEMSGTKRTLSTEDINGHNELPITPNNSPNSKKLRHDSSHSENEDDTQLIDGENGINNDLDRSSESESEEVTEPSLQENAFDYSTLHTEFDNGENDRFRYDGQIRFHIRVPTRPQPGGVTSQPTIIRTFSWTLLGFFQRNIEGNQIENQKTFSLFLKCNQDKTVQNWSIFAKAEFTLLHPTDPKKNSMKKINHVFNSRSDDWGYNNFKTIKEIYSEFIHPSDNTIRIEAKIHADPPRNVVWDSKGQTGFNGLRNIGATCYMNSFLQTIYFTKKLRKAVYTLPTDNDDHIHSIPLALQKLFYDLQFTDKAVNTKKLTRSFGWDKPDEFCQHDIQEFCRVLLDKLESKMEGTTMEGIIPSLYQGQYVQYVRCTKVDHESRVIQAFYDVPLQIRNNRNITESFRDFCKKEILAGENLYDAGSIHGLQEAEKGVRFLKFPPVLCLHLLRFEYDYNLSQNRKINDSYSFDYHLDLSEFLEKPNCSSCCYKLLSILVHSGDNSSGHYVSFINPELDEQWFKFDDDVVARVAPNDAMQRNFGGSQDDDGSMYNTSAYMLLYIREDCQNDVLCDINLEDIPENLIKRFDYEKTTPSKRRSSTPENDVVHLPVILNDDFDVHPEACLTEIASENVLERSQARENTQTLERARYIQAHPSESFGVFAQRLAKQMGVQFDEDIRIWFVNTYEFRPNQHYHSQSFLTYTLFHCDDYEKKMIDLIQYDISDRYILPIFIERKISLDGVYRLLPYDKDAILIFVRLYDSRYESLYHAGHFLFSPEQSLQQCLKKIMDRLKLSSSSDSTSLVHRSVTKHNQNHQYESIEASKFDLPLSEILNPCLSGASIIIQIYHADQTNNGNSVTTVDDYFRNLQSRQEFDVCNRDSFRSETLFKLYLPLKTSIKEVIRLIAERIEYPEEQIIIQRTSTSITSANTIPSTTSLHIGSDQKLKDLYLNIRPNVSSPRKIFFKRLPFHYTELEHRRLFRLHLPNSIKRDQQREVQFYAKNSSTIADFLEEIKQWIPMFSNQQLRMIELILSNPMNHPFELRICSDQTRIDELCAYTNRHYHLEEIIADEFDQNKDSVLIPVAHYIKENFIQINLQKFFPFFLHVIHNETYADVKHRLQTKLALTNREFEKYRFSIFNGNKLLSRCDDNMGRINLRELRSMQKACWLGLELPLISNPRKTRKSLFSEKPIRIN